MSGASPGSERARAASSRRSARRRARARSPSRIALARGALIAGGCSAADLLERRAGRRLALGELDQRRVGAASSRPAGPRRRGALAPGRQLRATARERGDRAGRRAAAAPRRSRGRARRWRPPAGGTPRAPTRAGRCPAAAAGARRRAASRWATSSARVAELLGGQRARVPARVAGGLADALAEHRAEQVAVAGLGAGAGEPGGDLGVEDVVELGAPRRGAGSRRPGGRRAARPRSRGRPAARPAARRRRRSSASIRKIASLAVESGSSTATWTRHSSAR